MRTELKLFRVRHGLNQAEMAEKCGVSRVTYGKIENGERFGNYEFWRNLQTEFNVLMDEMYKLMKLDEEKPKERE